MNYKLLQKYIFLQLVSDIFRIWIQKDKKVQITKEKVDECDHVQLKCFCTATAISRNKPKKR